MRNWIDIVKSMSAHDAPAAEPGMGYTLDGHSFVITDEHAIETRNMLEETLRKNGNTIYRMVLLRPVTLPAFLTSGLGIHWCFDWDINLDALTGWDTAPKDAELYRLTATVEFGAIDWPRSVLQNLAAPWEYEVALTKGAAVNIRAVDLLPDVDLYAKPVRQPVSGGSFRV